eukprot:g6395.t1 g6395   contig23:359117-359948(-)
MKFSSAVVVALGVMGFAEGQRVVSDSHRNGVSRLRRLKDDKGDEAVEESIVEFSLYEYARHRHRTPETTETPVEAPEMSVPEGSMSIPGALFGKSGKAKSGKSSKSGKTSKTVKESKTSKVAPEMAYRIFAEGAGKKKF